MIAATAEPDGGLEQIGSITGVTLIGVLLPRPASSG